MDILEHSEPVCFKKKLICFGQPIKYYTVQTALKIA